MHPKKELLWGLWVNLNSKPEAPFGTFDAGLK